MKLELVPHTASPDGDLAAAIPPANSTKKPESERAIGSYQETWLRCCLAAAVMTGAIGLAPALMGLWDVWTDDPLRSIGMLIVPASVILTLRVWRWLGWELRG